MSFFSRFFRKHARAPEWARFFTDAEYTAFLGAVETALSRRDLPFELGDGVATIHPPTGEPHRLGLQNLAQLCHTEKAERWSELVERHLDNVLRSQQESADVDAIAADLEKVRPLLKVRLFPESHGEQLGFDGLVRRVIAPGIAATLVFDLPTSVVTVSREQAKRWALDDDALFRAGLENVRAEGPLASRPVEAREGVTLYALVGDSFFTASHALLLEEHLGRPTPNGVLVAVPHRHAVVYHPIAGMDVLGAVNALIPMAFGMFQEGPGSVSPSLYWWRNGRFTLLPSGVDEKGMRFEPTPEFVAMLEGLAGAGSGGGSTTLN